MTPETWSAVDDYLTALFIPADAALDAAQREAEKANLPAIAVSPALGKFLRQSHVDELPQLWNILRGHMSLIGPRPEQPALVGHYREKLPLYDLRHSIAPGLSGWAQVNYGYAADLAETARKLDYDLEYVRNYGPKMDFIIVVKTFRIFLDPRFVR